MQHAELKIVWTVEIIAHEGLSLPDALASGFQSTGDVLGVYLSQAQADWARDERRRKNPAAKAAIVCCRVQLPDGTIAVGKEV